MEYFSTDCLTKINLDRVINVSYNDYENNMPDGDVSDFASLLLVLFYAPAHLSSFARTVTMHDGDHVLDIDSLWLVQFYAL